MGNPKTVDTPLVSIIVPAYNVEAYVRATLDSTLRQGLPPESLQIIVVDDGSTDRTAAILDEYAGSHGNIHVLHQENSGGPGSPRNAGIEFSTGKFLFFLDADDELTDNAMRDLLQVAEVEGSDVVLGKGEGINGRVVPGPAFRATKLDADLIEDNVYRTLSPWKLFRKDLIDRKRIRFHEALRIGEDQPFVASALLNAQKISVLADRPYARLRARGDGTNVTAAARSAQDFVELALAVVSVIVSESRPGRVRDGMLARPLNRTLRPIFNKHFLDLAKSEQAAIVQAISTLMLPHYNADVASHLTGLERTKMDLAVEGSVDKLRSVIAWEAGSRKHRLVSDDAGVRYNFPPALSEALGPEHIYPPALTSTVKLLDFTMNHGRASITAEVKVPGLPTRAPRAYIRLHHRETGREIDIPRDRVDATESSNGGEQTLACTLDVLSVPDGVWDLFAIQQYPGVEVVKRLGSKRSSHIDDKPACLYDGPRAHGVAYFTEGGGFLSLDIGFHVRAHRVPAAKVIGITQEAHGAATFVVSVSSITDARVALVISHPGYAGNRGTREVDARRLSDGIYGVRVKLRWIADGSLVRVRAANDDGGAMAELSESLSVTDTRALRLLEGSPGEEPALVVKQPTSRVPLRSFLDRIRRSRAGLD